MEETRMSNYEKLREKDRELVDAAVKWQALMGTFSRDTHITEGNNHTSHLERGEHTAQSLEVLRRDFSTEEGLADLRTRPHLQSFINSKGSNGNGHGGR